MPKPLTVWITINCGKFLKGWGIPDHLTCLLRNLYSGQAATVRTVRGTSSLITSWQTDEETMKTVADFIFGGSKITADGDCSHEIKRHLLLGRKIMSNLNSIFKRVTVLCQQRSILSRLRYFQ